MEENLALDHLTHETGTIYMPTACSIPTECRVSWGHPYVPPYVHEDGIQNHRVGLPDSQVTSQDPNFAILIGV